MLLYQQYWPNSLLSENSFERIMTIFTDLFEVRIVRTLFLVSLKSVIKQEFLQTRKPTYRFLCSCSHESLNFTKAAINLKRNQNYDYAR